MGFLSRFEDTMEDGIEGAAGIVGRSSLSPVQITKKAEKQMKRERIVGAGKQFAPTLYTVLVSPEDDRSLFKYYPTLAGETETYLLARAREQGYAMDGHPLVRFITDPDLRRGKFDVVAEMVASAIVEQLREDEMERYGISNSRRRGGVAAAAPVAARQRNPQPNMQPLPNLQTATSASEAPKPKKRKIVDSRNLRDANGRMTRPSLDEDPSMVFSQAREVSRAEQDANAMVQIDQIEDVVRSAKRIRRDFVDDEPQPGEPPVVTMPPVSENLPAKPTKGAGVDALFGGGEYIESSTFDQGVQTVDFEGDSSGLDVMVDEESLATVTLPEVYLYDEARDVAYQLSGASQQIGRESGNEIVVPDINISRVHAEIHREPGGMWVISDLDSTNGLFINGRKVRQAPLRDADMITLGTTTLEFQLLG